MSIYIYILPTQSRVLGLGTFVERFGLFGLVSLRALEEEALKP